MSTTLRRKRKRQVAEDVNPLLQYSLLNAGVLDTLNKRHCNPYTRGLQAFARRGGPDLQDLRGYSLPEVSLHCSMSAKESSISRRSAYDRGFRQTLIDNRIYPHGTRDHNDSLLCKPNNLHEIEDRLLRPRASLSSFSQEEFERFDEANTQATKERQVCEDVLCLIRGKAPQTAQHAGGVKFSKLAPITAPDDVACNPDVYWGARSARILPDVRKALASKIQPTTQDDLPIAPNFFLAVKGPDGTAAVANTQTTHEGACGARAIHALREYAKVDDLFNGKAYVLTGTYINGTLQIFASHMHQLHTDSPIQIISTRVRGWCMVSDRDTCKSGIMAFRNAMELTTEIRDAVIKQANDAAAHGIGAVQIASSAPGGSSTSTETNESLEDNREAQDSLDGTILSQESNTRLYNNASRNTSQPSPRHSQRRKRKRPI